AAGVLLIGRVYPLIEPSRLLLDGLLIVGGASTLVGGLLALTGDDMKRVLAYSTFSQYGYVVFLYGLGGAKAATAAAFYVLAHALAKSALFLTAGAVTEATGEDRLSRLGGLRKRMPVLAAASGAAAAGLAAMPLTIGFFKDEILFGAALERGPAFAALAVLWAALTLAYIWRFWSGIFLGTPGEGTHGERELPAALVAPVAALGALVLVGGILVGPFETLAEAAGRVSLAVPTPVEPAYHLDFRPENLMALAAYALGAMIVLSRPAWSPAALGFCRLGERAGPERIYDLTLRGLNRLSDRAHRAEVRDLRSRVAAILLPAGVLVGAGILVTPTAGAYRVGELRAGEAPLLLALAAAAVATLAATRTRRHVTLALVLSGAGFVLATVYAFYGAPDVALVAVLVETILTLLFVVTLKLIPYEVLHRQAELPLKRPRRKALISAVAAAFAFAVVWGALSQPAAEESVAQKLLRLTPEAHAKDAVTAILADFRGLDTLGEITVVALVLLGVATLLGRGGTR
ncbi:MAG: DUF4040 domain-containing protein, partial [Rubrobacter sp.]|nr:DUF4040 domain-containing protein [Rubrobacter sp.]